jgi:hypothetical protein
VERGAAGCDFWVSAECDSSKTSEKRMEQLFNPNFVGGVELNLTIVFKEKREF